LPRRPRRGGAGCGGRQAQDRLHRHFVGPASYLGQNLLDGFMLGVDELNGKLGGLPTEISKNDDQFKPDVGRQLAEKLVKRDQVDIVTGIVFSNVMWRSTTPWSMPGPS
jgi:branched-chain amino acid transport system substrate-binding protein